MTYVQYDVVEATFNPTRVDDLRHNANRWIGKRHLWAADWTVPKGPYEGQLAWTPLGRDIYEEMIRMDVTFAWVPTEDLTDIKIAHPSFLREDEA